MEIIVGTQGNQKIPINDKTVSRKHCRVISNGDGTFTVENLSKTSYTMVDGRRVIRTVASQDSKLQLGPYFTVILKNLFGEAPKKQMPAPQNAAPKQEQVNTYDITHLKWIWEEHNRKNIESVEKQKKINLIRTGGMVFSMGGGLLAGLASLPIIGSVCGGVGLISLVYSFIGMKDSETTEDKQARQDQFDAHWVCPNPECGRTLPAKNYKMLVRNHKSCPYCKSKYIEKA